MFWSSVFIAYSVPRILKRAIHLLGIYRKCSLNRHEDKKVLHRRSYIELGHILHARARTYTPSQVRVQKPHNVCIRTMCGSTVPLFVTDIRESVIVEVTLFRVGCVCRLIFWITLHAHAVTGNCARRCGKFSQTRYSCTPRDLPYILFRYYFFTVSRYDISKTHDFFGWNFSHAKIRGNTNFRQIR